MLILDKDCCCCCEITFHKLREISVNRCEVQVLSDNISSLSSSSRYLDLAKRNRNTETKPKYRNGLLKIKEKCCLLVNAVGEMDNEVFS